MAHTQTGLVWRTRFFPALGGWLNAGDADFVLDQEFYVGTKSTDEDARKIQVFEIFPSVSALGNAGRVNTSSARFNDHWDAGLNDAKNFRFIVAAPTVNGEQVSDLTATIHPIGDGLTTLSASSLEEVDAFYAALNSLSPSLQGIQDYPITATDTSLVLPIEIDNDTGTWISSMGLRAPRMSMTGASGTPAGVLDMKRPLNIPRMESDSGGGESRMDMQPALLGMTASTGTPFDEFGLRPGLRLFMTFSWEPPTGRLNMQAPVLKMPSSWSAPDSMVQMYVGPILPESEAGAFESQMEIARPLNIPHSTSSSGEFEASLDMKRPLNIPRAISVNNIFESSMDMQAPGIKMSSQSGTPTGILKMAFPDLRIDPANWVRPTSTMLLAGGVNAAVFRYLGDLVAFRRRDVAIDLPRVANEIPGGRYELTGLPAGLMYDAVNHRITGRTTEAVGDYTITIEYIEN